MKKIISIIIALIPFFAFSQEKDTIKIKEITINADKVAGKLQNMPSSITYIPSKQIEIQSINNLTELTGRTPNLVMLDYGSRLTSPIYIRGIGSRINSPSVGLYVDDVPYFDKGSFNFEFFNIRKIEVLRGPQGTLHGRNTMGGLIKIYTTENQNYFGGSIYQSYGNYNRQKRILNLNVPINNKFSASVNAVHSHGDGFFTNEYLNKKSDEFDTYAAQIKLRYQASDRLKFVFSSNYENNKQIGYPYSIFDVENNEVKPISYNDESSYLRNLFSNGLSIKYKTGNFLISSSTSFQFMADAQEIDQDFTPTPIYLVNQNRDRKTFAQEINIQSKADSKIKWLAGIFAFSESEDKFVDVDYFPANMVILKDYQQQNQGAAVFGQLSYPFGKFSATLGARYDFENANLVYDYDREMKGLTSQVSDFDNDLDFSQFLPKLAINYFALSNLNLYASVSKGYKAGNFNSTFERDEDISFDPEFSINYELGAKTSFFNRKLIANIAAFYIDWEDQQIYQPVPSGRGSMLKNAGESVSKGFEIELSSKVNKNLELWFGTGLNEAKFLDYQRSETTNYEGNYIPYVPKFTINGGFNFSAYFNSGIIRKIVINANYQHLGELYWNETNEAKQDSYGMLNAKIMANSRYFDFGLYGKNLLSQEYNAFYFEALGNSYVQQGKPLQFGVFAKLKF